MASPAIKRSPSEDPMPLNSIDAVVKQEETPASVRASSPLSSVGSLAPKASGTTPAPDLWSTAPPVKKRKLTPAEKEAANAEKERLAQEKAAQKAQKDEERRMKLEEKRAKDEEKEEKRRVRDAEKAAKEAERKKKQDEKDAEKKAKEDEKIRKEKAQPKIMSMFQKAASPAPAVADEDSGVCIATPSKPLMKAGSPSKPSRSVMFLPFEPPSDSVVAPYNRFVRDGPALEYAQQQIEASFESNHTDATYTSPERKRVLDDCFQPPLKRRRYCGPISVKAIIASMQGSQDRPIDLTSSAIKIASPLEALKRVPVKILQYKEDVRPPYVGTYTKVPAGRSVKSLSRKPFERALPKMNYDYDSEAEWEEPEEGEDLVSEGEDEPDEDQEDEMEGFLDDEESESDSRRRQVADVPPLQTAMHWEPARRTATSDTVPMGESVVDLQTFRIETLLEEPLTSIDPFSFAYWNIAPVPVPDGSSDATSSMAPPRLPLSSIPSAANRPPIARVDLSQTPLPTQPTSVSATKADGSPNPKWATYPGTTVMNPGKSKAGRPPSAPLPPELMSAFKEEIEAFKTMTKAGMIEILKKRFPNVAKATVTETLERVAIRIGEKQAEKHWVMKESLQL